jgi:EAL domain-containing protein (putative c-di-GMP-specific phosphodiesterase class I)/CHASE2 domain-containing sensor protein
VSKRGKTSGEKKPWKLLLWTAVAGLIFGLIGFGEIAEDTLRSARNALHWHKASGQIVVITIDDKALRNVGRWPWPRKYDAALIDRLTQAGASRIFFDVVFDGRTTSAEDEQFARSLQRSGRVILAGHTQGGPNTARGETTLPLPLFMQSAGIGTISNEYNFRNAVTAIPYAMRPNGRSLPSFSALLARRTGPVGRMFTPDYSVDPHSIPSMSAAEILAGKFDPKLLRGKDVIIGAASDTIGDQAFFPGTGRMGAVYVHVIGAETLRSGIPINLGWVPLFVASLAISAFILLRRKPRHQGATLGAAAIGVLFGPTIAEAHQVFLDVTPGLFIIAVIGCALAWRRYRLRGLVNPITNLPNLNALRAHRQGRDKALVAARVLNYEEILAALPPNSEAQLVEQIVSRLRVGSPNRVLYEGDAGIFAWFEDPQAPFGHHLDALYALFRNPARVGKLSIDLAVAFGVEVGSGRSVANRLASALVAADEAAHDGLKWKYHDPETLEDASWRLSILSQLDDAIDNGEVWVAYQPKLDIRSGRITGAEALARWTHPQKGPIAATEFVSAAEQHDRIGKLTDYVLEKAVAAAAEINKRGTEFEIAVNLSAKLLSDRPFTLRLSALLARHGLAARHLTLELTETAALTGSGEGLDMILRLRDLGVNIAIDDYGTGLSTLDYLRKIPANEIKIDQSFVRGIVDNRSDRLMVQSTIGLAHSLGRRVVAEGVESRQVLDVLVEIGCDMAQGYTIGRPMSLESLTKRLADRRRTAA